MDIVQRLWGFCNTLRHDGINYGDYIEQLTYLLFLKLADEKDLAIPAGYGWTDLRHRSGASLLNRYTETLHVLGGAAGILGDIFAGAISRFRDPVNLKKLINLIDETEWATLDIDLKGEAYEGLLQKYAAEQKGAGQYFTPRPVIRAVVHCLQPDIRAASDFTVHDPACGTGGFLLGASEWMHAAFGSQLKRDDQERLQIATYSGRELVLQTRRLALMNLFIHEIEGGIDCGDSIVDGDPHRYDVVFTNPPFGTKGAGEIPNRDDFAVATSNKQLNFIQHVLTILKPNGRSAIVVPDNVLFEEHAGRDVRRLLMANTQLHTILRLPVGTFTPYSAGVKSNVLFFTKGGSTDEIWIYDQRTNVSSITKSHPLTLDHFADFITAYGPHPTPPPGVRHETVRFRCFTRAAIHDRDDNLDIVWLKDEEIDNLDAGTEPEDLLGKIIGQLQIVQEALNEMEILMASDLEVLT